MKITAITPASYPPYQVTNKQQINHCMAGKHIVAHPLSASIISAVHDAMANHHRARNKTVVTDAHVIYARIRCPYSYQESEGTYTIGYVNVEYVI